MALLEVSGLNVVFTSPGRNVFKALDNINLHVSDGELVSCIGPSGCGKSTLLDSIAGLILPGSGRIILDGKAVAGRPGYAAYMMQEDVFLPWKNLEGNVSLPLELAGTDKKEISEKLASLAGFFGLASFLGFYPGQLSGGMKQRASLMRVYVSGKRLLLMDEPFAKLDALNRIKSRSWFLDIWQKKKLSVLLVTHDIDEALFLSDRIYVMSPSPGRFISEITVPFKRPRGKQLITSSRFMEMKARLLKTLSL